MIQLETLKSPTHGANFSLISYLPFLSLAEKLTTSVWNQGSIVSKISSAKSATVIDVNCRSTMQEQKAWQP